MPYTQTGMGARPDLTQKIQQYAFAPDTYAAELVFPAAPVANQAGTVSVVTRKTLLQIPSIRRSPLGGYNRINARLSAMSYECEDKGLEHVLAKAIQDPPGIDMEMTGASLLAVTTKGAFEAEFAALAQDTSVFNESDGNYVESSVPWVTVTTADPIADVLGACDNVRELTGIRPNALVINADQLSLLLQNAKIQARFPGAPAVTYDMLKSSLVSLFGLQQLIVSNAVGDSDKDPSAISISPLWDSDYALVAVVPPAGSPLEVPALGRTLDWAEDSNGWVADAPYYVEADRTWILRARRNYVQKVIDPLFGCLIDVTETAS